MRIEESEPFTGYHERIAFIMNLERGWHDGYGEPVHEIAAKSTKAFLSHYSASELSFAIFPLIEGGISIEFESDGWDYGVDFYNHGFVEFYGLEIQTAGIESQKENFFLEFRRMDSDFFREFSSRVPNVIKANLD